MTDDPRQEPDRTKPYNGFVAIFEQCKLRMAQPVRQATFWQYLLWFVLCCGLPVAIEAYRYWVPPLGAASPPTLDNLILALVTVFFAVLIPSSLDLIFGRNKLLLNLGVFSAIVSALLLLFVFFGNPPHSLAVFLGVVGCLGAIVVWWIDRGPDEIFQDRTDPDDAVGGDPTKPLAERQSPIRT